MTYPQIIIPNSFKRASSSIPPVPSRPIIPQKPQTTLRGTKLWLIIALLFFLTFLMNAYDTSSNIIAINLIGLLGLGLFLLWGYKNKEKNERILQGYSNEIIKYPNKIELHERQVSQILSPDNVRRFQEDELRNLITKSMQYSTERRFIQRGKYEPEFEKHLLSHFGNKIITSVSLGYFDNPYSPDFAYIDDISGLKIDIEVDEPYVGTTKQPIHFIGSDDIRNDFFTSNGWVVIRFAEWQIAKQPKSCCKEIASVISEMLKRRTDMQDFENSENLNPVTRWTLNEAITMARNNFRDTY